MEIIKPKGKETKSKNNTLMTAVMYMTIGIMLAFYSNQAVQIFFYIVGIIAIIYGIKSFLDYYDNKDTVQYKNINLSVAIVSVIIGILLFLLSNILETSIRFVLGFFLIFMGVSRILTQYSFGDRKLVTIISNIILIIMGVYSIFVSNAILLIIGWILIANAVILFWEYFKK